MSKTKLGDYDTPASVLAQFEDLIDARHDHLVASIEDGASCRQSAILAYECESSFTSDPDTTLPFTHVGNKSKFGLQQALQAASKSDGSTTVPLVFGGSQSASLATGRAWIARGDSYTQAIGLLAFCRSGLMQLEYSGQEYIVSTSPSMHSYEVLDGHVDELEQVSVASGLGLNIRDAVAALGEPLSKALISGSNSIRVPWSQVHFNRFNGAYCSEIRPLPPGWDWRGVDGSDLTNVLNSLVAYAAFQSLLNEAASRNLLGRGPSPTSTWNPIPLQELVKRVSIACSVDQENVSQIVEIMTFGSGTRSPDPAIQPLMKVGDDTESILVPNGLLGTSRMPRNFLTLTARTDRRAFDSKSALFEHHMIKRLALQFEERGFIVERNTGIPGRGELGDVDLLIVSPSDKFVLCLELKFNLDVAEARERTYRIETSQSACSRQRQRVDALRDSGACRRLLQSLADPRCAQGGGENWKVEGLVVFASFSSASYSEIPVISERILKDSLASSSPLPKIVSRLKALEYVPRIDVEYRIIMQSVAFDSVRFQYPTIAARPREIALRYRSGLGLA